MKSNRMLFAGMALAVAVMGGGMAFAADQTQKDIDQLNKSIAEKGGKWVAGRTSVSDMSSQAQQYLVGLGVEPLDIGAAPLKMGRAILPESLDWRANNGDFVTGVRNQGQCGSCWAFAMTGALESYALRAKNTPNRDLDLSEQVMVSCSGAGSCKGGRLNADYLTTTGLPPESYYPYTQTDGSCSNVKPGWEKETNKIGSWGSVSKSVEELKAALNQFGPVPTAFMVYRDFMSYKSGVYSYTSGELMGGHGVLLVGYNDAEKYFIVKNSWGPNWGENGFFKIAYSEMDNQVKFGMMTIAYYTDDQAGE
ncbi:MAG: C1 family peptidase [Elusimicrobiaceae bacterium]|nr:C1 family peptidase [Elusimicrobiaceae bacterium]